MGENVDISSLVSDNQTVYYSGSELVTVGKVKDGDGGKGVQPVVSAVSSKGASEFSVRNVSQNIPTTLIAHLIPSNANLHLDVHKIRT